MARIPFPDLPPPHCLQGDKLVLTRDYVPSSSKALYHQGVYAVAESYGAMPLR